MVIDGVMFNTGDEFIAMKPAGTPTAAASTCQRDPSSKLHVRRRAGGINPGSEMTGGLINVYARDLTLNSANLQAGHRIKTNTLRGGDARNSNVNRMAGAVGGPLLRIQGNYDAQTGDFPPDITGIMLADWTVGSCAGIWSLVGASATDPVGTVTLDDLTITSSTAANSAQYVSNLLVEDVTVGGTPVTP